jgi:hypothetical protein
MHRSGGGGELRRATTVDALADAVGTSHAMVTQDAALDFKLIRQLGTPRRRTVRPARLLRRVRRRPDAIYLGEAREVVAAEVRSVLEVLGYGPAVAPCSRKS